MMVSPILVLAVVLTLVGAQVDRERDRVQIAFWNRIMSDSSITDAEGFIREIARNDPNQRGDDGDFDENGRPNERALGTANGVEPTDRCLPKLTSVRIDTRGDPLLLVYPPCVQLYRCGGCCGHPALKCSPARTTTRSVKILESRMLGGGSMHVSMPDKVDRQMEIHTACECRCAMEESDCNLSLQTYEPGNCRCRCINESTEMPRCNVRQIWDPENCECVCKRVPRCEAQLYFNTTSCLCELASSRAREFVGSPDRTNTDVSSRNDPDPGNPCATEPPCTRPSYYHVRVGNRCRCAFSLFGPRRSP